MTTEPHQLLPPMLVAAPLALLATHLALRKPPWFHSLSHLSYTQRHSLLQQDQPQQQLQETIQGKKTDRKIS